MAIVKIAGKILAATSFDGKSGKIESKLRLWVIIKL
jgi:hypothetical protein